MSKPKERKEGSVPGWLGRGWAGASASVHTTSRSREAWLFVSSSQSAKKEAAAVGEGSP